jgi:hypothetical protein
VLTLKVFHYGPDADSVSNPYQQHKKYHKVVLQKLMINFILFWTNKKYQAYVSMQQPKCFNITIFFLFVGGTLSSDS